MMTTAQTERSHRTTVLRVAAATWLLLISAVVVIDHVILSTRADRTEDAVPATQLSELEAQLAELAREIEQQRQEPAALPLGRYESERVALDQRLAVVERAVDDRPTIDLQSLQTRIDRLEVRLADQRRALQHLLGVLHGQALLLQNPQVLDPFHHGKLCQLADVLGAIQRIERILVVDLRHHHLQEFVT